MKKIYLDYLATTRDRKDISYEELRLRINGAKSVSTIQRIFTGQTEPTVEDFEMIIEQGLGEDIREVYALIGAQEFKDSERIDYKGAKELMAEFAAEKEALRKEFADRLAHAKEMRIAEQAGFKIALESLEDKYNKGTAYLKRLIEQKDNEIGSLTTRALKAETELETISNAHDAHCREIHRKYRYLSWGCIGVVVVALLLGWFVPPPWML